VVRKEIGNLVSVCIAVCFVGACATPDQSAGSAKDRLTVEERINRPSESGEIQEPVEASTANEADSPAAIFSDDDNNGSEIQIESEVFAGSGNFINIQAARRNAGSSSDSSGDVVLNFENSDIREVVKTILGDMLGVNYLVDPAVSGEVTLSTSQPMNMDQVLPTLEALLRMNGAILRKSDGIYSVVPSSKAFGGSIAPQIGLASDRGFQLLIVPLRYIAASEMQAILQPLLPESSVLNVDPARNLLLIGGARSELEQAQATVSVFDTNQMQGMSVGLFRMKNADAESVVGELRSILGAESGGPMAEMIQFITVARLNAVVVLSKQSKYLDEVSTWINRLDRADETAGQNMYVYPVHNGRAENLAGLLSELFLGNGSGSGLQGRSGSGLRSPSPTSAANGSVNNTSARTARPSAATGNAVAGSSIGDVRIIADLENNALVIMASRSNYAKIKSALRRLDVIPLQVLVEATIVEVSLTEELSYGLQWFFHNNIGSTDKRGIGELFPLTVDPSFSYTIKDQAGNARAVLNLLAADSRLNVISSPSLMVLDNHTATIKVGDQVPIRTSETSSLASSGIDPLITSTIQYRDTGVVLEVTPRVNPGGMVMLELTQDVDDVDKTTTSNIDSPTIIQRSITTSVAVQSGETVVLGGLIRDNESVSESGIPFLRSIPGLGRLFSSKTTSNHRTELLVLITPTAISNLAEARDATEEMKRKLAGIDFET
jgi:general secretion pathway protein D